MIKEYFRFQVSFISVNTCCQIFVWPREDFFYTVVPGVFSSKWYSEKSHWFVRKKNNCKQRELLYSVLETVVSLFASIAVLFLISGRKSSRWIKDASLSFKHSMQSNPNTRIRQTYCGLKWYVFVSIVFIVLT